MRSVRLRLLVLALAPMGILLPIVLLLGMTRWTSDYDALLISKVESDLRIAEQYLARIMTGTGDELTGVAESAEFSDVLQNDALRMSRFFSEKQDALGLDFLYYLPSDAAVEAAGVWPVIHAGLNGRPATEIDIFSAAELMQHSPELAARAQLPLIETEAAVPTDREIEDRGMVVHAASPVRVTGYEGVLVGGVLLNRNLDFIDTINALVYLNAVTGGELQGTATLFLEDVRVSTNVRLFEDVRALGTRVSAVVRDAVLGDGQTWLNRAFVVNDWYISGYLPLTDSFGTRVGMLYVGFLEAPFVTAKHEAIIWVLVAVAGVLTLSIPVFLGLARGVFAPLERITATMRRVGKGDLSARHGEVGRGDEIGQVGTHLDGLLDQLQERDRRLRDYAEELNDRVDQRTRELRKANEKLEQTYRQLVMSEKLAAIGEITAGVAHEINNPVAVIQGNVDVIRDTLGTRAGEVETELGLIDRQVVRIIAIVSKLLQFARPSEFSGYADSVSLATVIEDCLVLVDHVLSRGDINVTTYVTPAPDVRADPGELQQVVVNLILNAAQAMGQQGQLAIGLGSETRDGVEGACITVTDTGPGIPEDKLDSVFDPFFTTKQAEGTGLGLSISQTLIQRTGGLIEARNRPEGGAEFTVWLPSAVTRNVAAQ